MVNVFCRVEQYTSKGWDKNVENPEAARQQLLPPDGWKTLGSSDDTTMLSSNHGHMIAYFVERRPSDNIPASDVKSLSTHTYALSQKGHVQNI